MHAAVARLERWDAITNAKLADDETAIDHSYDYAAVYRLRVAIDHEYV